ncbi:MAG TPA: PadR family transcriptional regulator [Solirubrobacteraceae bacterium]
MATADPQMPDSLDQPQPQLTPTGRVILGMITLGRRSGYDIKQFVDKTTRHFWAASYGQIYPELKRLEDQGLIIGRDDPAGGRARTVYELTDAGTAALHSWLRASSVPAPELRDEGMLKLFFSDALPEQRIDNIRAMRAQAETKLALLGALEDKAKRGRTGPYLTLQLGLAETRCLIGWCQEAERRLAEDAKLAEDANRDAAGEPT